MGASNSTLRSFLSEEQIERLNGIKKEAKLLAKKDPQSDIDKVISALKKEKWKNAFKLAEELKKTFSNDEINKIALAYECMGTSRKSYEKLGVDIDAIIDEAKKIIQDKILGNE